MIAILNGFVEPLCLLTMMMENSMANFITKLKQQFTNNVTMHTGIDQLNTDLVMAV